MGISNNPNSVIPSEARNLLFLGRKKSRFFGLRPQNDNFLKVH